jgi:hypothetical protein
MKFPKKSHEIWNYFITKTDETKVFCNICNQSYNLNSSITNLKAHFAKNHKTEYNQIITKHIEKKINKSKIDASKIQDSEQEISKETRSKEIINIKEIVKSIELEQDSKIDILSDKIVISGKCKIEFK